MKILAAIRGAGTEVVPHIPLIGEAFAEIESALVPDCAAPEMSILDRHRDIVTRHITTLNIERAALEVEIADRVERLRQTNISLAAMEAAADKLTEGSVNGTASDLAEPPAA